MTTTSAPPRGGAVNILGLSKNDYRGLESTLCAGCGHDSISAQIISACYDLGIRAETEVDAVAEGEAAYVPTELLHPGLKRLLDVRRAVGLRNSAHSLVKLMNPCAGPAVVVSSYTHPEYAVSMAATYALMQSNALLLRGTEGEPHDEG